MILLQRMALYKCVLIEDYIKNRGSNQDMCVANNQTDNHARRLA